MHYVDPEPLEVKQVKNLSSASGTYIHTTGSSAFVSFINGSVCTLDIPTAQLVHTKEYNSYEIWCVLATESLLFVPGSEGELTVYDRCTDNCVFSLHAHHSDITSIALDGHSLSTGSYDGSLRTYDIRSRRELATVQFPGGVWRHLPSGRGWLAACMEEGFHYKSAVDSFMLPTTSLAYSLAEIFPNNYIGCSFYSQEVLKFTLPLNSCYISLSLSRRSVRPRVVLRLSAAASVKKGKRLSPAIVGLCCGSLCRHDVIMCFRLAEQLGTVGRQ